MKIKKTALVSVIMNCHNGEKYLSKSLKSLLGQSYKNWELIFYDNISKDKSLSILNQYKDNRVKIFKTNKLINLYHARNLAITKTKGKYISFLDVDDFWDKNKLKYQIEFLERNKEYSFLYSNYYIRKESTKKNYLRYKKKLKSGNITQELLDNYTIGILTVFLKRSLFKKYSFKKKYNIIGDFDLFLKISQKYKIAYIDKPLATYRLHANNYSAKSLKKYVLELDHWIKFNKMKLLKNKYSLFKQKIYLTKLKFKLTLKNYMGV